MSPATFPDGSPSVRRIGIALALSVMVHIGAFASIAMPRLPGGGGKGRVDAASITARLAGASVAAPTVAAAPSTVKGQAKPTAAKPRPRAIAAAAPQASTIAEIPVEATVQTAVFEELPVAAAAPNGEVYFSGRDVDERAVAIEVTDPEYPAGAESRNGYLVVQVFVNELGTVDRFQILISDPEGVFDDAVRRSFESARFRPAIKNGVAVKTESVFEIKFVSPTAMAEERMQAIEQGMRAAADSGNPQQQP